MTEEVNEKKRAKLALMGNIVQLCYEVEIYRKNKKKIF